MAERIQGNGVIYSHNYVYTPDGKRRPYKTIFNYKKSGKDFIYDEQTKKWFVRDGKQITDITDKFGNNNYTQVANMLLGSTKLPKQGQNSTGNSTGDSTDKRKPAASNERKPAAASAPRSNFSTPTPTYYTSLEKGITGYGLDPDQKKYLESLGVKSVKELQERLNTDLKSGLVVDDKWGKRTQDAFTAGYNAWKNQQQERPQQPQFDYNQLFSQWNQWMNQQPRQQRIIAMPATYDRYDIRHWLKENGIKGITAGGRKALRFAANGEAYDTRYKGIVDQYLPMLRGNQGGTQSTPTMDPRYAEYFQNLIGTSFNDLPAAYNNLRTKGNVDDMYAPEYSTFHRVYDWMKDNPDAFQQAKQNMIGRGVANFATTAMNGAANLFNALNTFKQNNPQQPSISTPPYRVSTDTHTNPMQSNKLFQKVSDWANQNLNLRDYSSNNQGTLFAKEGGYIPKFQNPAYPIWDMRNYLPKQNKTYPAWDMRRHLPDSNAGKRRNSEKKKMEDRRKTKVAGAKDMSRRDIMDLQDQLWQEGFFEGTGFTYDQAVDGIIGAKTKQAMEKAKNSGYTVTLGQKMKKTPPQTQSQSKKEVNKEESNVTGTPSESMIGSVLDYLFPSRVRKREEEEALRNSTNFDAVKRAKVHNGVTEPYWYFDPKDNVAYRMQGDKVLDEFEIGSGLNQTSDGFTNLVGGYDRSKNLSSTGAGVFTLWKQSRGTQYNNEPVYKFRTADGSFTNQAWHGAATPERKLLLGDGNEKNNKVSFGCIYGPDGKLRCFEENGQIHTGDSAYVEPKLDENYFYYDMNDGKIKTHFENMPSRLRGKNFNSEYDLNNIRYNTSY